LTELSFSRNHHRTCVLHFPLVFQEATIWTPSLIPRHIRTAYRQVTPGDGDAMLMGTAGVRGRQWIDQFTYAGPGSASMRNRASRASRPMPRFVGASMLPEQDQQPRSSVTEPWAADVLYRYAAFAGIRHPAQSRTGTIKASRWIHDCEVTRVLSRHVCTCPALLLPKQRVVWLRLASGSRSSLQSVCWSLRRSPPDYPRRLQPVFPMLRAILVTLHSVSHVAWLFYQPRGPACGPPRTAHDGPSNRFDE